MSLASMSYPLTKHYPHCLIHVIDVKVSYCPTDPAIIINDVQVPRVHEVIHLGHKFSDDIYKFRSIKCVEDFNRQSNNFQQILNMPTLILAMPYFRIIALRFMAVKFFHYLAIVWRISIQHEELLCVESGGFHGELIIIC